MLFLSLVGVKSVFYRSFLLSINSETHCLAIISKGGSEFKLDIILNYFYCGLISHISLIFDINSLFFDTTPNP